MFSLSIAVTGMNSPWRLLFKDEESATKAVRKLKSAEHSEIITIADDFGQTATFHSWTGYLYEDMESSKQAAVALMLYNHSIQMDAQKKAQQTAAGPAVLTPGMAMGGFRQ